MDKITDEEMAVVEELRNRTINDITPTMLEDVSLFYRFSKARDFDIQKAEKMLRKHIDWRKESEIDTILSDYKPPEVLLKYIPISFVCIDKDGCAVLFHDLGRADTRGLLNAVKKEEILKYMVYMIEQNRRKLIKGGDNGRVQSGRPIIVPIYNFEELTYSKAVDMQTTQILLLIIKTFLDNYPEYLDTIMVINAPFFFSWMYAAFKPVLPSTVIQKVRIYGTVGWKEALLEKIDANVLPVYLGGNKTDPDGSIILLGQNVPKSYYMQKRKKKLAIESDVKKLSVLPFSKQEINFLVKEENSILEWEFETKNRDIEFSLIFRGVSPTELEPVTLIPKEMIDTSFESEKGFFKCEKVGNYTIVFDNSFSWFHSKEVYYRGGIKIPKNSELYQTVKNFPTDY